MSTAIHDVPILGRLFPARFDNAYAGLKPALWAFGALVFVRGGIGLRCVFDGAHVASQADGIPMATFAPAAARMIASDFATWGLMQTMLCLVAVIALVRYRSMVPLLAAIFLLEHLCRKLILHLMPVVQSTGAPGGYVNLVIFGLEIAAVVLAVWPRGARKDLA